MPASHLEDMLTDGAGFAGFAAGEIGQRPNDPDMTAMPTRAPHAAALAPECRALRVRPARSRARPWPYCPRTILRRQLERAAALGFEFGSALELEYFLVRRREDGSIEVADALDTLSQPCYDMRALTRGLDFVTHDRATISALGWDNYATDHEDANGQFEQNFAFADALTTCDRSVFFRYMVESIAAGARPDRHLHAQAVLAPDRQRLPLPHEPLARRRERVRPRPRGGPAGPRPLAHWPTSSSPG